MNTRWYVHKFDAAGLHIWTMVGCGHAARRREVVQLGRVLTDDLSSFVPGYVLEGPSSHPGFQSVSGE